MTSILKWLEEWYNGNCDGDWQHEYGIKIETVDNPGSIKIALSYTPIESLGSTSFGREIV